MRPSYCWTRRLPRWTPNPNRRFRRPCRGCSRAALSSPSLIVYRRSMHSIESWCSIEAASSKTARRADCYKPRGSTAECTAVKSGSARSKCHEPIEILRSLGRGRGVVGMRHHAGGAPPQPETPQQDTPNTEESSNEATQPADANPALAPCLPIDDKIPKIKAKPKSVRKKPPPPPPPAPQ